MGSTEKLMKLTIQNSTEMQLPEDLFSDIMQRANPEKTVELLITNDEEIQQLNAQYREKDKPTDVLSFPLEDDELLGQIVISLQTAERQAQELGQSTQEELKFLFAHGIAHLFGHDHQNAEEEPEMLKFVYKILNRT